MTDPIALWLASNPHYASDPLNGMAAAGLTGLLQSYTEIARMKAQLVERTGLLGIASVWGGRQLVFRHFFRYGSDEQVAAWSGTALAVAISEPKVGAHPKLLTTRAVRAGDGWVIDGQKAWVTNGPDADAILVFAITGEEAGRKRFSAFIVPRGASGLSVAEMPGFHALRPSRHCLLTLEGVRVPGSAMLGDPDTAYERMALPFRDVEDAVGTFATLGAFRYAIAHAGTQDAEALGAVVALTAVFSTGAEALIQLLDGGRFRTGDATLVGLRVLAGDILARLRGLMPGDSEILSDLEAVLNIARGPRLARQAALGVSALGASALGASPLGAAAIRGAR